jgi:hypothetical protein
MARSQTFAVNVSFNRTRRRKADLPSVLTFVWTVVAAACSSAAPSPPTSISGPWEGQVEDVRVRMDLTESSSGIAPSWRDVHGTGSLTGRDGRSLAIAPDGWNVQRSAGSLMNNGILINLNRADRTEGLGYGQFNGDLVNGDLVGTITLTPAEVVLFSDHSVARFTRP